ncbi:hypothetical protein PT974_09135 [Cladobotryum mycophilum]|uniref:Zn(2)-C6 fungal-type domain-containing protein n=1 Tax=Cladobotryum mycophilum TaxID=491253 RepID=A0ABR0SGK1_9HYPO
MSTDPAGVAASGDLPKHRACDECRFRKIACSKEPDGCARCKKEGIQCHYSPQKPMGRPRKRRHVEESQESLDASPPPIAVAADINGYSNASEYPTFSTDDRFDDVIVQPDDIARQAFDLHDWHGDSNMSFIDLLPDFYPDSPNMFTQADPSLAYVSPPGQVPFHHSSSSLYSPPMNDSTHLGTINFDDQHHSTTTTTTTATTLPRTSCDSPHHYAASHHSHTSAPSCSSPGSQYHCNQSPETIASVSTPQSGKAMPNIPCTCLSSLYFALNSLSQLPSNIPSAMRVARHASKMAHQVINCPECYDVTINDPTKPPPIQCFQNLMCLGALVPSACNAYASILEMVDVETDRAKGDNRKLWFSFSDVGETWSHYVDAKSPTSIRQILRVDVHGFEGVNGVWKPPTPTSQPGANEQRPLKGVVTLLDEKNRKRHEQIDELIATGQMPENSPYLLFPGGHKVVPPEARNCVRVLETARIALSNLVIA